MVKSVPPEFAQYRAVLDKVRAENPNMPYRQAQKEASTIFHSGSGKKKVMKKPKAKKPRGKKSMKK